MKLQEAKKFIADLQSASKNTSEIKACQSFLELLEKLTIRDFSARETESIENELNKLIGAFNSNSNNSKLGKQLKAFKIFLKDKHSLISKGYYLNVGISMGTAFGVVLGVLISERLERSLGLTVGIGVGMLLGMFIGKSMDNKAKALGNVL